MIQGTTTRPLSVTLRTLYPGAFASYQGVIFRVVSPGIEVLSGVSEDPVKSEKTEEVLDNYPELAQKVYKIIQQQVLEDTGSRLPDKPTRPIRVRVPGKVDLRLDETLENVYCTNIHCGTLWKLRWSKQKTSRGLPQCALCGSRVQQAPIFFPVIDQRSTLSVGAAGIQTGSEIQCLPNRVFFCHYKTPNGRCRAPTSTDHQCVTEFRDMLGSLAIFDPQRPIESLKIHNPDCPKKLDVPPIDVPRPHRQNDRWFSLDFPRESLNVPLTASSVVSYDEKNDPEIDEVNEVLKPLLGQFFKNDIVDFGDTKFTHMHMLETVYGYRLGNRISGVTTSYIGISMKTVLGRAIDTKGFQITIKPSIYEKIQQYRQSRNIPNTDEEILQVILHSLKHALLVEMPIFTGLDENKFHGTFEINENKEGWAARVYVYDTEDGGSGGFSTIIRNRNILETMLDDVRLRRINCPVRDCQHACKHCLYIKNCGFVNRKLHRKLLIHSGIFQAE